VERGRKLQSDQRLRIIVDGRPHDLDVAEIAVPHPPERLAGMNNTSTCAGEQAQI
jgi:hypothetical protein